MMGPTVTPPQKKGAFSSTCIQKYGAGLWVRVESTNYRGGKWFTCNYCMTALQVCSSETRTREAEHYKQGTKERVKCAL
jgi:hypothetical protein